ncbi:DUF441 domain-containing protein [Clostridium sp. CX1]|uniref:UPF0756 membrane protein P8V03_09305 n=1 Tax=Clostridium tanneri TaxID=3037988 RepID=A0ABU4JTS9_9CLOT|nr:MULTISPECIES: DUF441 domain-containing protein [unclassified Clostridium]MCT8975418.1 DUF441 domain-containing protein [Clostridium sp. CX1]MDW8801351.1 DUF441 domain-containing protein [Clostridium sp. A1-XYC3]
MLCKIILILLAVFSFFAKNKNMSIAAIIILILTFSNNEKPLLFIEKYFLDVGMIFLMMWMLVPIVKSGDSIVTNIKNLLNINGMVSLLSGIFVAVLAAKGIGFLKGSIDVMSGVIIGSIVGIALLGGAPVGPLIASGIAYEVVKIINLIFKNS